MSTKPPKDDGPDLGNLLDLKGSVKALKSLAAISGKLLTLIRNPRRFIVGTVLSAVVGWVLSGLRMTSRGLRIALGFDVGGQNFVGLIDLPRLALWPLLSVGETAGGSILDAINGINLTLARIVATSQLGAATPVIVGGVMMFETALAVILVYYTAKFVFNSLGGVLLK